MKRGVQFLQSAGDFPVMVSLGKKVPAWGLCRWGGAGLRFVPADDEGFSLRGDKGRLLYKGRRRSHRFTILGDAAFEYDCILHREPESNVITLLMEGAEGFDFFRQPDFLKDPFLAGSYAVYKKETFIGEGTGKLCHIHRPLVIDGRGRRCWGELSVAGNKLSITIPEGWLSEAEYPVVVDPAIGTTTVGSQYLYENEPGEPWVELLMEMRISLQRFLVPQNISGLCTAYAYTHLDYDEDQGGRPALYSDNSDRPDYRKSAGEGFFDLTVNARKPGGWRSATFRTNAGIAAGSYVWFGVFTEYLWFPRFDWGARLYNPWWIDFQDEPVIPERCPEVPAYDNFKLSMYFEYSSAQSYTRTLTQGITLTDSRKLAGAYKRSATQTVRGTTATKGLAGFYRSVVQSVKSTMSLKEHLTLIRKLAQQAGAGDVTMRLLSMVRETAHTAGAGSGTQRVTRAERGIADTGRPGAAVSTRQDFKRGIAHGGNVEAAALRGAGYVKRFRETAGSTAHTGIVREVVLKLIEAVAALYETRAGAGFNRGVADTAGNNSIMGGMVTFFRTLFGSAGGGDSAGSFITRLRVIQDTETAGDETGHTADYLRGLFVEAGAMAGTVHWGEYYRKQQDTAYSEAVSLRQLFVFIRLLTGAYIRDYIIGRFLKSKEELVIKSAVVREIILESRLH